MIKHDKLLAALVEECDEDFVTLHEVVRIVWRQLDPASVEQVRLVTIVSGKRCVRSNVAGILEMNRRDFS